MASQVGPHCYATALQAAQAIASAEVGRVVPAGSAVYVVDASSVTASTITYTLTPLAGGPAITQAVAISPQPCGLLDWSDGLSIGWGIATAWVLAFAVLQLRKGVHA